MRRLLIMTMTISFIFSQGKLLWSVDTESRVYSSPAISGDTLYIGSGNGKLYAVNKTSGKIYWTHKSEGAIYSDPIRIKETIVYSSQDGKIYCIDRKSGKLNWVFETNGEKQYGLWDYYIASPVHLDGVIYHSSGDGFIYAINSLYGSLIWKKELKDILHATPLVDGENVYIASFDGHIYKLNRYNGAEIWRFKSVGARYFPKGEFQRSPVLDNGILYVGSRDYNLYAINSYTGTGEWNLRQPRGWVIATPTIYKDMIIYGTSDSHLVIAQNKNTGEVLWEKKVPMRVYGSVTVHDDILYFGCFDGILYGVDPANGETVWKYQTPMSAKNYSSIFKPDGSFKEGFQLYGNGYLESEKTIHNLGSILSTPKISDGIIYFGSSDGHFYAVEL